MAKFFGWLPVFLLFIHCQEKPVADVLLVNGKIYSMEHQEAIYNALAIKGERILGVGSQEDLLPFQGGSTKLIDLQGHTVLPGFTDSHVHPISGGLSFLECDLAELTNIYEILDSLRRFAEHNPERTWIRGENAWLAGFAGGNPDKRLLDSIIPGRPVFVSSLDGHSAWVNSQALQKAGISRETADPPQGRVERYTSSGEPSGTLREKAIGLVSSLLPLYTAEDRRKALVAALKMANSLGITSLVEASAGREFIDTYLELAKAGELTAHVNISLYADLSKGTAGVAPVLDLNQRYRAAGSDVKFDQVKLFMDGVVEGKTAAMLENYIHEHHAGIPNADDSTAIQMIKALDKAKFQVHVHAIGDRGIRTSLDAFEQARRENGAQDLRHHIAHLQVIHPQDIPRFRALDVIANFQALWATWEDSYMSELNYPFLGPERAEWQYPIGTVAKTGATIVFGSDWPVSTMNPWHALQVAVTRRGPDTLQREPWTPQHVLEVYPVLEGYTRHGSYMMHREDETGTLTPGKLADFIVVDQDPMTADRFHLMETKVLHTYFKGKKVFSRFE